MDQRARLIPAMNDLSALIRRRKEARRTKDINARQSQAESQQNKIPAPQDINVCNSTSIQSNCSMEYHMIDFKRTMHSPDLKQAMSVNACYLPMLEEGYASRKVHQLALWGHKGRAVRSLMDQFSKHRLSMYSTDSTGNTPLMLACAARPCSFEVIKYLVENTTEDYINVENKLGLTALHFATLNNEPDVVDFLLSHKANVNAGSVKVNGKQYGLTSLLISVIAFRDGNPNKCLTHLLKWNPDMTVEVADAAEDNEGLNFRWECECGGCVSNTLAFSLRNILPPSKITTARMWFREGTALYQLVRNNCSRSHLAAMMDHMHRTGVYDSIMEQPTDFDGLTIFGVATSLICYELMEEILQRDPTVVNHAKADILGVARRSPLHILLSNRQYLENEIICANCQKDTDYKEEKTRKCIDLLLETSGIEVEIQDVWGQTPLMVAAQNGHDYACEKLINMGADPLKCDYLGDSPMMFAMDLERDLRVKIIQILLRTGCSHKLAKQPFNNSSLLWKVMIKTDVRVLRLLHLAGAIGNVSCVQMMDEVNMPRTYTSEEDTQAMDEFRLALIHISTPPPLINLCLLFFSSREGTRSPEVRASGLRGMITGRTDKHLVDDQEMEEDRDSTQTTNNKNETTGLAGDYHSDQKLETTFHYDEKEETDSQRVLWGMCQSCFKDLGVL